MSQHARLETPKKGTSSVRTTRKKDPLLPPSRGSPDEQGSSSFFQFPSSTSCIPSWDGSSSGSSSRRSASLSPSVSLYSNVSNLSFSSSSDVPSCSRSIREINEEKRLRKEKEKEQKRLQKEEEKERKRLQKEEEKEQKRLQKSTQAIHLTKKIIQQHQEMNKDRLSAPSTPRRLTAGISGVSTDRLFAPSRFSAPSDVSDPTRAEIDMDSIAVNYVHLKYGYHEGNVMRPEKAELPSDDTSIRVFLRNLNAVRRCGNLSDFEDIAIAVHRITEGHSDGLRELCLFASKGNNPEVDEDYVMALWENVGKSAEIVPKSCRTLAYMLKEDNPELYAYWHSMWVNEALIKVDNPYNHINIARVFYRYYWLDLCTYNTGTITASRLAWQVFRGHKWCSVNDAQMHPYFISFTTDLYKRWTYINESVKEERERAGFTCIDDIDPDDPLRQKIEWCESFATLIQKQIFGSLTTINNILNAAKSMFYDDHFVSYRDFRLDIKGVKNGVIHCLSDRAVFRPARIEDYVTKEMGTYYDDSYSLDHPDVLFWINEFMGKLFVDPELVWFMRKNRASFLVSGNEEKLLRQYLGNSNAGKTLFCMVDMLLFGKEQYAGVLDKQYFLKDVSNAEAANSALKQAADKAIVIVSEFDENDHPRSARLKAVTGNEEVLIRGMGENFAMRRFQPKIIFQSNHAVQLNAEPAFINRNILVPFESYFAKPELSNYQEILQMSEEERWRQRKFLADPELERKCREKLPALLWLTVHDFAAYRKEGLRPCQAIIDATNVYWKQTHTLGQFVVNCLTYSYDAEGNPDKNVQIDGKTLYEAYKQWYMKQFPREHVFNTTYNTAIDYMVKNIRIEPHINTSKKKLWYGVSLSYD